MPDYEITISGKTYEVHSPKPLSRVEMQRMSDEFTRSKAVGDQKASTLRGQRPFSPGSPTSAGNSSTTSRQRTGSKSSQTPEKLTEVGNKSTAKVSSPKETPLQQQARQIILQNQVQNEEQSRQHSRELLAPYHAIAQPLSQALSIGVRGLNEAASHGISSTINRLSGKPVAKSSVSPLQQEINRQLAHAPLGQRLSAEDPRGFGHAVSPDTSRSVEAMASTGAQGVAKGLANVAMDFATVDNAVIAAAMAHPAVAAGEGSQLLSRAASGYFGYEAARNTHAKLSEWKKSGFKDTAALTEALASATMGAAAFHHGTKGLRKIKPKVEVGTQKRLPSADSNRVAAAGKDIKSAVKVVAQKTKTEVQKKYDAAKSEMEAANERAKAATARSEALKSRKAADTAESEKKPTEANVVPKTATAKLKASPKPEPVAERPKERKPFDPSVLRKPAEAKPKQAASNVRVAEGKAFVKVDGKEQSFALPQNPKERTAAVRELQAKYDKPVEEKSDATKAGMQPEGNATEREGNDKGGTQAKAGRGRSIQPTEEVPPKAEAVEPKKNVFDTPPEAKPKPAAKKDATVASPEATPGFKAKLGDDGKLSIDKVQEHFFKMDTAAKTWMDYIEGDDAAEPKVRAFAEKKMKFSPAEVDHLVDRMKEERQAVADQERAAKKAEASATKKTAAVTEKGKQAQDTAAKVKKGEPLPNSPIVGGIPEVKGGAPGPAPKRPLMIGEAVGRLKQSAKGYVEETTRQISNWFNRGLTGIERNAKKTGNPALLRAARKYPGTVGQIHAIMFHTMPLIREALGGTDAHVQKFYHYLAEGSLRGARERWQDFHERVIKMPDTIVDDPKRKITDPRPEVLSDPKVFQEFVDLLEKVEGRRRDEVTLDEGDFDPDDMTPSDRIVDPADPRARDHFAPRLADRAKALFSNGSWDELRILLAGTFDEAARSVGVMDAFNPDKVGRGSEDFDAYGKKPETQEALKLYRENIGNPLSVAYQANKGERSRYLGPLETWFPLVPHREGGGLAHPITAAKATFGKVTNPNAFFKTGLSDRYDTSAKALMDSIEYSLKKNNRGALINTMRDIGLAEDLPPGVNAKTAPKTMMVAGVEVPAVVRLWKEGRKITTDGRTYFTKSEAMLVPKFVSDELTPILEQSEYEPHSPLALITQAAITGPNAALIHNYNLQSALVAGTPFLGKGMGKIPGTIPGLKLATAVNRSLNIDPTLAKYSADIRELAELGLLHPKTGTVTASEKVSRLHGVNPETGKPLVPKRPLSAMLYGIRGSEIRTRLQLLHIAKAAAEESGVEATPEDIYDMVSQAGIYANGLDSVVERGLKKLQIAPFVTAGKTMIGTGTRALTFRTPLPRNASLSAKANLRARQMISSSLVGATGLWFATYKLYTGKLPSKKDRFNEIPIKQEDRDSPAGQMIFGPGHNQVHVSLDIANSALARAMHASGVKALIDGVASGQPADKTISAMHKDTLNGLASPITSSPQAQFLTTATAGKYPYLVSWHGAIKNRVDPQLIDMVDQEQMGPHRLAMQGLNALINANPYTQVAGQVSNIKGIHVREDRVKDPPLTRALKTGRDLLFPRAFPFQSPPGKEKDILPKIKDGTGASGLPKVDF